MEENKNLDTGTLDNGGTDIKTDMDDIISMSKVEYEKILQATEDKIRTKYSTELKTFTTENQKLKDKIEELSAFVPVEKSEAEKELEKRLLDLESKHKEVEDKERFLNLQTSLSAKNIDISLADYLKADTDIEAFGSVINKMYEERNKANAYVPTGHSANIGDFEEKWAKSSYAERVEIYNTNPELAEQFINKRS